MMPAMRNPNHDMQLQKLYSTVTEAVLHDAYHVVQQSNTLTNNSFRPFDINQSIRQTNEQGYDGVSGVGTKQEKVFPDDSSAEVDLDRL